MAGFLAFNCQELCDYGETCTKRMGAGLGFLLSIMGHGSR